jgi:uncharacterized protein (DUF1786 family)
MSYRISLKISQEYKNESEDNSADLFWQRFKFCEIRCNLAKFTVEVTEFHGSLCSYDVGAHLIPLQYILYV